MIVSVNNVLSQRVLSTSRQRVTLVLQQQQQRTATCCGRGNTFLPNGARQQQQQQFQRRQANIKALQNRTSTFHAATPAQKPSLIKTVSTSTAIGVGAGVLGSLAGMGGGFVMIPAMTTFLGVSQHVAHGTSLFAVTATGIAGAVSYADHVQWDVAAAVALTGMCTARLGAKSTAYLSEKLLKKCLGILMIAMAPAIPLKAAYMERYHAEALQRQNLQSQSPDSNKTDSTNLRQDAPTLFFATAIMASGIELDEEQHAFIAYWEQTLLPAAAIGIGSGFLAGLFGVGGGTIVVPALTLCMPTDSFSHYQALATSLAAMTLPALSGTVTHAAAGNVAFRVAPALAAGAFAGAYLGGQLGLSIDETKLRWGFSSLIGSLGLRIVLKA